MSRSLRGKPIPTSWSDVREILRKPLDELSLVDKFVRYFFVGGLSAVVDYAIFGALFHFGLHYLVAATLSFVVAVAFNYALSVRFVFQTGRPVFRKYDRDGALVFERHIEGREIDQFVDNLPTAWPRRNTEEGELPYVPPTIRTAAVDPA